MNKQIQKEYESYYRLESDLANNGLNHILNEITEIARTELLENPKTTAKAQELILEWWKKQNKPEINSHRMSYFLLWHLRKFCKVL